MKILSPSGLAIALPLLVQGCATPLEFSGCDSTQVDANCDVIYAVASEFEGDASVDGQGGTPSSGTGGSGNPAQGGSGNPAQGGSGNPAQGGSGNPAQGGSGPGIGGTGQGGTAQAGAAGEGGAAGAAGSGTGGTAGSGTAGTGNQAVFDPASCDFQDQSGCLSCVQRCPTNDGGSCAMRCNTALACPAANTECIIESDPLCRIRLNNGANANVCTMVVDSAGPDAEAIALALVECLCSLPRPGQ
jgi:hypothetical protein